MKKKLLYVFILAGIFSSTTVIAQDKISFGIGSGALYNGLGANIAVMKKSDLKYLALGCIAIGYSSDRGVLSNCGVGAGWVRSDILSKNDKHGLGIHIGLTYNTDKNNTEAFIGIPYLYFFKGMFAGGWNVGLAPIIGETDGETRGGLLFNLGYQF